MKSEIKAIIEKNLPAEVGNVLKKVLEQGQADAIAVTELQDEVKRLNKLNNIKATKITLLEEFQDRAGKLDVREAAVVEKEIWHANTMLKLQLEEANKRSEMVASYTTSLLRNTSVRKEIFDSETQAGYPDGNGTWQYPSPVSKSFRETKEEE
jgi:hypothetical protein